MQVFWDYYSDPQVYQVRQVFTGTQQAWQSAVDSMVNGWVSSTLLCCLYHYHCFQVIFVIVHNAVYIR